MKQLRSIRWQDDPSADIASHTVNTLAPIDNPIGAKGLPIGAKGFPDRG